MSTQENKAITLRFFEEVINKKNIAALEEYVTDNFLDHGAPPGTATGPEGVRQMLVDAFRAFPDLSYTNEDIIAEGDMVMSRGTSRGTHLGDFQGIPASGKHVAFGEFHLIRMEDGKLAEVRELVDALALFQQLGVAPPME